MVDVEVLARDDDRLGEVLPALQGCLDVPVAALWSGSTRLPRALPLTAAALRHGAVLGLDEPAPRAGGGPGGGPVAPGRGPGDGSALELHVVAGPDAGRTVPLARGRHVLGRGGSAAVALEDPDVSRRHVEVQVGGGGLVLRELGSSNGTHLGDQEVPVTGIAWPTGTPLRIGGSALMATGPGGAPVRVEEGTAGRARVHPSGRLVVPAADVEVPFPRPPSAVPARRLAWVAVALPALGGVLLAVLLRTPAFLFLALLAPLVAVGTWWSDRSSGRRTGRREEAAYATALQAAEARLAEAVAADVRATEAAHPDLATLAAAARRRTTPLWSRRTGDGDALTVRVGTARGATRVLALRPDGAPERERTPHLPVLVDLRTTGGLAVVGPRGRALGVLRAAVLQLVTLHPPGEVDLLLLLDADRMAQWAWTRWLPHLPPRAVDVGDPRPTAEDRTLARLAAAVAGRGVGGPSTAAATGRLVVVVDRAVPPRLADALRSARGAGSAVLTLAGSDAELALTADAVLRLGGETGDQAVLSRRGATDTGGVAVDRAALDVAARVARDLAALAPAATPGALPAQVRLLDLLPSPGREGGTTGSPPAGAQPRAAWTGDRDRLVTTVGCSAAGPVELDLCRSGPHALVAGTTGAGKSELLQTLIAGWALNHPPDRCSFLLVDYKGGAAFAEAASLPHTVGLLTDLDGASTARALSSLTAELARREAVLAAAGVADIADLADEVALARLVIVVDEFATLAEELPAFVGGLVGIAQRGRSLGVHLLLATQRPGGVVSPEIRANCSLRVCLRTTDEGDSRDVLGTAAAAHLPADLPGRAYVRHGSGEPVLVQVARVAVPRQVLHDAAPAARRWAWPVAAAASGSTPADPDVGSDLAAVVAALRREAGDRRLGPAHRPWCPPLPDDLSADALPAPSPGAGGPADRSGAGGVLGLGLVDLPRRQAQEPLLLDLRAGGSWLVVGGPRSGRTTFLRTVLGEAVASLPPDQLHVHVVDRGGGALAAEAAALPHTGTAIGAEDPLRTVRLVDRLTQEVAARRSSAGGRRPPLLLLLVDGTEAVGNLLDEHDPARGSGALLRLLRDGAAVGVTCVLTADRAVPGSRWAGAATRRLVLPLPDRADYAVAGVPARAVPGHRPPGRALLDEEALECQLARPRPGPTPVPAHPAAADEPDARRPLRIVELPADPVLALPAPGGAAAQPARLLLPVGPGGDEGEVVEVDLARSGGLLVGGPPASGRSTALDAFAGHLAAAGHPVLLLDPPARAAPSYAGPVGPGGAPAADRGAADGDGGVHRAGRDDAAAVAAWAGGLAGRTGVLVVDDLGTPADVPALTALTTAGRSAHVVVLASGGFADLAGHYQGPVGALRRNRSVLLLCPGPGDADLLGCRLPRTPVPDRPGSGWLVTGGRVSRLQVARRGPRRSS